jgi:predicted nuclease of predicted toxin-antitoxin system
MPWKPLQECSDAEALKFTLANRSKAKFLIDENLGPEVTRLIRNTGWTATDAFELNLAGQPDEKIFATARKKDLILLTHDDDFLNDRFFHPRLNPGIFVLPGGDGNEEPLRSAISRVLSIAGHFRKLWHCTKSIISSNGTLTVMSYDKTTGRIVKKIYRFIGDRVELWEDAS